MKFFHRLSCIIALALLPGILFLAGCAQEKNAEPQNLTYFEHYPYAWEGNIVYVTLGNAKGDVTVRTVPGADLSSFKTLERGYAKDSKHVFFYDKTIKGADPQTFKILYSGYAYESIDYGYSRDKDHVYFDSKLMEGVDPKSFEILGNFYLKDKDNVYYYDGISSDFPKKIEDADAKSFRVLDAGRMQDKNHIYQEGVIIKP